jgi:hypothetical protein
MREPPRLPGALVVGADVVARERGTEVRAHWSDASG